MRCVCFCSSLEVGGLLLETPELLGRNVHLVLADTTTEKERLPTEVGWTRPAEPLAGNDLFVTMDEIRNATAAATGATPQQAKRMFSDDIHGSAAREWM